MKNPIKNIFKVKNKANIQEWIALADFLGIDKNMNKDERSEATYFACLKILSESVGKLPLKLMQKTDKNGVKEAKSHPLYTVIRNRPNRFMTATTFWGLMEYFRDHQGNGIAYISGAGSKMQLIPLDYSKVEIWYDDACILSKVPDVYYLYNCGGNQYKFSSEEVLHFKFSISDDGIKGLNVREVLRTTIDGNKKAQKMQNNLYESGFTAKAAVQYTGELNSENVKSFLSNIEKYAKGEVSTSKSLIPIPIGSQLIPLNTKLGDNEFLELKKYSALQIAAAFGIKPVQINDYSKSSYASNENQNLTFLVDTLLYILKQYEEELNYKLLSNDEIAKGFSFKFNTRALLRTNLKEQIETLSKGVSNFIYTSNEARSYLDLEAKPGGDELIGNGSTIKLTQVGLQYGSKGSNEPLNINKKGGDG
jgi:HK97 family phage portal protein